MSVARLAPSVVWNPHLGRGWRFVGVLEAPAMDKTCILEDNYLMFRCAGAHYWPLLAVVPDMIGMRLILRLIRPRSTANTGRMPSF